MKRIGRPVSQQLKKAIRLLRSNPALSVLQAAERAGVDHSTIYRSSQYKALMAERAEQGKQQQ